MKKRLIYLIFAYCACAFAPHMAAEDNAIERFAHVVDSLHSSIVFPHNIGPGIVLTNVGVDKNERMLVIGYMLNPELVESVVRNAGSENGIAQILTGYDEVFSISMIDANAGYKILITSPASDGSTNTETVTVPASAIPAVYTKLKNGDYSSMKPYLEMLADTFSHMQFPVKIAAGIYLTEAYITNNQAHYVYKLEDDIDVSNIPDAAVQNIRMNLANNLRKNISPEYMTEIEEKGISLFYTYNNEQGELLYEFVFTAENLK